MEDSTLNNNKPNVLVPNIGGFNSDSADEMYVDAPADPRPVASESEPNNAIEKTQTPHLDFHGSEIKPERGMETPQHKNDKNQIYPGTMVVSKKQTRPGLPDATELIAAAKTAQSLISNYDDPNSSGNDVVELRNENDRHHIRRETVVVESSLIAEVKKAFKEIREMDGIIDPIEEIEHRITSLFLDKEKEFNAKLLEVENRFRVELNVCNFKLRAANEVSAKAEKFLDICRQRGIDIKTIVSPDGSAANNNIQNSASNLSLRKSPQEQQNIQQLIRERDSIRDDLNSLENNYSELFKRYEKMRENCSNLKTNEDALKERIESLAKTKEEIVSRYYELRDHAHDQLTKANNEITRLIKQHDDDTLGLRLGLKSKEAQVTALQATLDSKTKENAELSQICEELIKKSEMVDSRSD